MWKGRAQMKTIESETVRASHRSSAPSTPVKLRPALRPLLSTTPRPKERILRTQLAKHFFDGYSKYGAALEAGEHVEARPELARALVQDALESRATDIHLSPGIKEIVVRFRIDGAISDVAVLNSEQGRWLTNQFKALAGLDPVVRFTPKDSHAHVLLDERAIDLRLALAPCQRGEVLSIRLLDPKRLDRSICDLGLPEDKIAQLNDWLENTNGMLLCAGPTGSGKTTTIYALLNEVKFADRVIVSIEDPVEYELSGINQVQLDEKHHLSFAEGVKAMLRLDPDFLMIGEIRDSASAHAAVDAALTGRVLLSTVHARDASSVVTVLRNWGLHDHEIAESLTVVVAQRLVRKLCPNCREITPPSEHDLRWLKAFELTAPKECSTAPGCNKCNGLGYYGRTGLFELWRLREADYQLILNHCDEHALRAHFHGTQHENLLQDGLAKVATGITSLTELRRASSGAFPFDALEGMQKNGCGNGMPKPSACRADK